MNSDWSVILNILYIFIVTFVAKLIKEKLGLFKSIIVPTALLAGFIGLLIGPEVLGLINFDLKLYEKIVFHAMALGFIALTLAENKTEHKSDTVKSGLYIVATYCFQGVVGMLTVWGLIYTIKPDLFDGLGLMLPLAYGQGPGFASSIGSSWDEVLPFGYVNQYGLTLATAGFLVAGILGVFMLNYFVRKYKIPVARLNRIKGLQTKELSLSSVKEINFFDMLTVQFVWIAIIYLGTFLAIKWSGAFLSLFGSVGETIASLVKGFNFLFGILLAIVFKKILQFFANRGHRAEPLLDSYLLNNVSSLFFNIMITASIMAISVETIKEYWELLLVVATVGAIATYFFTIWLGRKMFLHNTNHYILAMFGMLTGTASTGLALLRGIDPDLQTDVAKNLVLGSAVAAPLGFPLMAILGIPIIGFTTNNPIYTYITFIAIFLYMALLMGIGIIKTKKEKVTPGQG
ncbi:MAG: S-layer homology domain-containing protein [Bacillota bacterium]|nr:S-layer homology domain-containing protein [Bacillota bacterium]